MPTIQEDASAATVNSAREGQGPGEGARRREGKTEGGSVGDVLPGIKAHRHTLWLYPVMVEGGSDRAGSVVKALLWEGFDATRAPTSLMPIDR